jgi:hypothetical protein
MTDRPPARSLALAPLCHKPHSVFVTNDVQPEEDEHD